MRLIFNQWIKCELKSLGVIAFTTVIIRQLIRLVYLFASCSLMLSFNKC
jgi:hypothetical protein